LQETSNWCTSIRVLGIDVVAIPGNHDLKNDRYDSLSGQPLGLLFKTGIIRDVSYRCINYTTKLGNAAIDPTTEPSNSSHYGVSIVGIPYPSSKVIGSYNSLPAPVYPTAILLSHCFGSEEGGDYFGEPVISYAALRRLPFSVYVLGHDHSDNGVTSVDGKHVINIGAISRGSVSVEDIRRSIKCAIIEVEESKVLVRQVVLNYTPSNECFDLTLKAQKVKETQQIEEFVELLSSSFETLGAEDVNFHNFLDSLDVSNEVRRRVLGYIEQAEQSAT